MMDKTRFEICDTEDHVINEKYYTYSKIDGMPFRCRVCHSNLKQDATYIPLSASECVKIDGRRCVNCGAMFIESTPEIKRLLEQSPKSWKYEIDK